MLSIYLFQHRYGYQQTFNIIYSMAKLREEVLEADTQSKKKQYESGPKSSFG